MHPVLAKFGPLTVYSYGAMVAFGFGLAALLIYKRAPRFGLDKDRMLDAAVIILIAGIIGARLLYVFLNINYYAAYPLELFNLSKGGLVWYGGFLTAFITLIWYAKRKRLNFWNVADLIAPYIALAQGFGRIGCFLNGCCYGIEVPPNFPLCVVFPGERIARIPTELYSSLALFIIFLILLAWQERRRFAGEIFLGYLLLYSVKRFLIEFLRGDNPRFFYGLTLSQVISIAVFFTAAAILAKKVIEWKRKNSGSV